MTPPDELEVKRDRTDIGVPAGTRIAVQQGTTAGPGELVVAVVGRDYVLRRWPVDDGPVVGVVLGRVVEVSDAD